jgi:hypothetical protein
LARLLWPSARFAGSREAALAALLAAHSVGWHGEGDA